jgi:uncharacterized protein (TIGR00304 family)
MREFNIIGIGVIVIIIGFLIVFVGSLLAASSSTNKSNVKVSFFGLLGPIPIGFSNDKGLFIFTIILSIVIMILMFLISRGAR